MRDLIKFLNFRIEALQKQNKMLRDYYNIKSIKKTETGLTIVEYKTGLIEVK